MLCTFWLGNVLRATTACNFSTSQLLKMLRTWCVLYSLTSKCASRQNGVLVSDPSICTSSCLDWGASKRVSEMVMFLCFCNCFCAAFGRNDLTCAIQFCLGALSGLLLPNEVVRNMNINIYAWLCHMYTNVIWFIQHCNTLRIICHFDGDIQKHFKRMSLSHSCQRSLGTQAVAFAKGTPQ